MADVVAWETVRRAAEGDDTARRRLVDATLDSLWAMAMRLTRRPDAADDVVQETYARVLPNLAGLAPTGRFEGYLARVAANLVVERWRRERPARPLSEALASPEALEPWRTVARAEDEQRRLAAIWEAARRLAPQPRAAFLLFYAHGQSCEAISEILEAPVGTIKTWLHRSRNEVRRMAEALLNGAAGRDRTPVGDAS